MKILLSKDTYRLLDTLDWKLCRTNKYSSIGEFSTAANNSNNVIKKSCSNSPTNSNFLSIYLLTQSTKWLDHCVTFCCADLCMNY